MGWNSSVSSLVLCNLQLRCSSLPDLMEFHPVNVQLIIQQKYLWTPVQIFGALFFLLSTAPQIPIFLARLKSDLFSLVLCQGLTKLSSG